MITHLVKPIFDKYEGTENTELTRLKMYYDLCQEFPLLIKFEGNYKHPSFLHDLFVYIAENSTQIIMEHRNKIIDSII